MQGNGILPARQGECTSVSEPGKGTLTVLVLRLLESPDLK